MQMRERSLGELRYGPLRDNTEYDVARFVEHIAQPAQQHIRENQKDREDDAGCGMTEVVDHTLEHQRHRDHRQPRGDHKDDCRQRLPAPHPDGAPDIHVNAPLDARALPVRRDVRRHSSSSPCASHCQQRILRVPCRSSSCARGLLRCDSASSDRCPPDRPRHRRPSNRRSCPRCYPRAIHCPAAHCLPDCVCAIACVAAMHATKYVQAIVPLNLRLSGIFLLVCDASSLAMHAPEESANAGS